MRIFTIALIVTLLAISPSYATENSNAIDTTKPTNISSKGIADVEKVLTEWQTALSGKTPENIVSIYDKDAILYATLAAKPIKTQKERLAYFSNLMQKQNLKVTLNEKNTRLLDVDNAVISGIYTFSFEDGGKTIEIPARYTFIFERKDNRWMIIEHHSSKVPE